MKENHIIFKLINGAVYVLQDDGHKDCNMDNIFTVEVYRSRFKALLQSNLGQGFTNDATIQKLISRIEKIERAAERALKNKARV